MAIRFGYYDFDAPGTPTWNAVAFPDGDSTQVPRTEGVYRFIFNSEGNKQTLFADIAPSTYGHSLRACFNHHVAIRKDTLAELYDLYIIKGLEFEHFKCSKNNAKKHKHYIVSNSKPFFNMTIELKISNNSIKKPFDN